ncbi:MAG: ribonuclease HI [Cytophagaceae bacterium]|nr:ribonuclease HI [Cytophagaceae bacterium]MDW8456522.1 ribonuclease HI [Cytophagaceae bacterium]
MTEKSPNDRIIIYTDGACKGNPGPGGYGIILTYKHHRKELKQGFRKTTNNRMELLAVIVALEAIKDYGKDVTIYTDSKYVAEAVSKGWLWEWEKKNFKDKKNEDLWRRFIYIYKKHNVTIVWLKGHDGHPENERCDRMAVESAEGTNLSIDYGYEHLG